jgi:hypothetical protein
MRKIKIQEVTCLESINIVITGGSQPSSIHLYE